MRGRRNSHTIAQPEGGVVTGDEAVAAIVRTYGGLVKDGLSPTRAIAKTAQLLGVQNGAVLRIKG